MSFDRKVTLKPTDLDWSPDFNYSYDYIYYGGEVCDQGSSMHFDSILIPVLYSLALVVGLLGNGLVLVVLWKKRRSWNVTDIFIHHLSLADVLLLVTLPLRAVEVVKGWSFGTGLCKLTGALFMFFVSSETSNCPPFFRKCQYHIFLHQISLYCGVFMLTCISLDLYLSIIHAVQMKPMVIHCCCLTIWLFCLLLSIPNWMYRQVLEDYGLQDKTECSLYGSYLSYLAPSLLYHVVGFTLPAIILLYCFTRILLRLKCGSHYKQKKRALRVILALVLSFLISWMPYNITLIIDTIRKANFSDQTLCDNSKALNRALTVTSALGYLNWCITPVLYAFVGGKFRKHQLV